MTDHKNIGMYNRRQAMHSTTQQSMSRVYKFLDVLYVITTRTDPDDQRDDNRLTYKQYKYELWKHSKRHRFYKTIYKICIMTSWQYYFWITSRLCGG